MRSNTSCVCNSTCYQSKYRSTRGVGSVKIRASDVASIIDSCNVPFRLQTDGNYTTANIVSNGFTGSAVDCTCDLFSRVIVVPKQIATAAATDNDDGDVIVVECSSLSSGSVTLRSPESLADCITVQWSKLGWFTTLSHHHG